MILSACKLITSAFNIGYFIDFYMKNQYNFK